MKNLWKDKQIKGAVVLIIAIGVVNSIWTISQNFKDNQRAQVFSKAVLFSRPETLIYGVDQNNFGAGTGITINRKQVVTVEACGAGGGGGGGGRGWENGGNGGNGGGGGGGGGRGACDIKTLKLRPGDVIHWNVGWGGAGGVGGVIDININMGTYDDYTGAESGTDGGNTYVSVNGVDVRQLMGGRGGFWGENAWEGYVAEGGLGGSFTISETSWHRGQDGVNPYWVEENSYVPMGGGGRGGRGENNTNTGELNTPGQPGTAAGSNPYGGNGGTGNLGFGGGGGGGGAGRWYDYDDNGSNGGNADNSARNQGGTGGYGGNGYVIFYL